ncbi:hypothetical protein [Pseudomonas sp. R76]|uniref:hypothetical protein n=1 Tax=Pseudomonas sp. R76 TaxID=1573711 RepID=UPI00131F6F5B|nr:hypothetical protein [Pseudomonas sp. R76]QHD09780.1 hypothetical protein PspR76_30375 [Pseudomonas sp. R76]
MKDDRLRISVDNEYIKDLGLATFAFAQLEWNVVWCCECLQGNYIRKLERKTAGNIASDFIRFAKRVRGPELRAALVESGENFKILVKSRNGLLHAKPGTDKDGGQRLFRDGASWTTASLKEIADEFTECSLIFNAYIHGPLKRV